MILYFHLDEFRLFINIKKKKTKSMLSDKYFILLNIFM